MAEVKRKQRELEEQNTLRRRALGTEVANRTKNILAEAAKLKTYMDTSRARRVTAEVRKKIKNKRGEKRGKRKRKGKEEGKGEVKEEKRKEFLF